MHKQSEAEKRNDKIAQFRSERLKAYIENIKEGNSRKAAQTNKQIEQRKRGFVDPIEFGGSLFVIYIIARECGDEHWKKKFREGTMTHYQRMEYFARLPAFAISIQVALTLLLRQVHVIPNENTKMLLEF